MTIHKDLASGRWFTYSLAFQLANVGADVDRAMRWKQKGEAEYSRGAFERALELLDLTIADPKHRAKPGRLKELCRVREFFIDYFLFDNQYGFTEQAWNDYFYYFSYIAAAERGV